SVEISRRGCLPLKVDPTAERYTLSLHDALPICDDLAASGRKRFPDRRHSQVRTDRHGADGTQGRHLRRADLFELANVAGLGIVRSEEHTSELQSRSDLVCRLLLEKKKLQYTVA